MTDKEFDKAQLLLTDHYRRVYAGGDKHDSPERSKVLMAKHIITTLQAGLPVPYILNIGSGPQALEKHLVLSNLISPHLFDPYHEKGFRFVTLDIASISSHRLLMKKNGVKHIRGSALNLPFATESFGLIVSNLAIDFLPSTAFAEAARVLHPEGTALFNFHHPAMIATDLGNLKRSDQKEFWSYLKRNQILFEHKEQIAIYLGRIGLSTSKIALETDGRDQWWEVTAHKANN